MKLELGSSDFILIVSTLNHSCLPLFYLTLLDSISRDEESIISILQMSKPKLGAVLKKDEDGPKGQSWHLVPGFLNPDTTIPSSLDSQTAETYMNSQVLCSQDVNDSNIFGSKQKQERWRDPHC